MSFFLPTKLQTLFWEIKNRSFYVAISFILSFVISYQNSTSLLYLFVLSYGTSNVTSGVTKTDNLFSEADGFILSKMEPSLLLSSYLNKDKNFVTSCVAKDVTYGIKEVLLSSGSAKDVDNVSLSSLLYFYKILKNSDVCFTKLFFIFTGVEEAFSSQIFVCLLFCFVIIVPIFFYESFSLFIPSLHLFEKQKWVFRVTTISVIWFFFIYNVQYSLIPKLTDFLLKFQISSFGFSIIGQTKINSYCFWAMTLLVGSSIIYFLLFFVFFCVMAQKIKIEYFTRRRKISRAILLLFSALIVPPEVQLILAFVALFFFELAIYFFYFYKNITNARTKGCARTCKDYISRGECTTDKS